MAEWLIENTGHTRLDVGSGLMDLLDGTGIGEIIEIIDKLKDIFGQNFEKLYELDQEYNGKAYTKEVKNGSCCCGSCDDIYELHICINR